MDCCRNKVRGSYLKPITMEGWIIIGIFLIICFLIAVVIDGGKDKK